MMSHRSGRHSSAWARKKSDQERVKTPHGNVDTPAFMPVATQGTVKTLTQNQVEELGASILLANTYHLMLRPGAELVDELGGVQRFMAWPHAVLTDSGGYQVFSLAQYRKLSDDGVVFQSHLDGTKYNLTPEEAMRIQSLLGSDIAMVLDECPDGGAPRKAVEVAVRRTSAWARGWPRNEPQIVGVESKPRVRPTRQLVGAPAVSEV